MITGIALYIAICTIAVLLDTKAEVTAPQVYFVLGGIAATFLMKSF